MMTRNLLWAVLASSIFSLLTATIFFILDAVDVSLTEAAVGAGIATILFVFTLKHLEINLKKSKSNNFKVAIKGEISLQLLNSFISCDVIRNGKTLRMINYQVIEKIS